MDFGQYIKKKLENLANGFTNTVTNAAPKVGNQIVNNLPLVGPAFKAASIVNSSPQMKQNFNQAAQNMGTRIASNPIVKNIASQPLIQLPGGVKAPFSPTVGQYAQGQFINPIKEFYNAPSTMQRVLPAVQVGFNVTPSGNAFNVLGGGVAGALRSLRTGQNLNESVSQAMSNPSSIATTGLDVKNPFLAFAIDAATSTNPKGLVKNLKGLKNISANVAKHRTAMAPGDVQSVKDVIAKMLNNRGRADYVVNQRPKDETFLRQIAADYLDKNFAKTAKLDDIAQELMNRVRVDEGASEFALPSMGLVGKQGKIIPQARPGDYSNSREIDKRIADKFSGRSVVGEIKGGFESGRRQRDAVKVAQGQKLQNVRSQLVDRLSPVYDFTKLTKNLNPENDPYKKMRLLAGVSGKAEAFVNTKLAPILQRESKRLDDLSSLLVLDRENELIGRGLQRKRGAQDIQRGINELKTKYGEQGFAALQDSAKQIRNVGSQLLEQLHDSGIIDKQSFETIKSKNQFYAPFEAVDHIADSLEKGHGTGSFNVASQDAIKRIQDYTGDVADPIETLVRKIPKVISLVEKNKAIQSLVNLKNIDSEIYGSLIKPIKNGEAPEGYGIVNAFINGKNQRFAVPQSVETAVKNLDADTGGILIKLGSIQAKMLRAGATTLNIGFIPVNILRDIQDSLTTELSENGAKAALQFIGSYPKAIFAAAMKNDLYNQWLASGGAQSTMTEQIFKYTPETVSELAGNKQGVLKTIIRAPKMLIEFANEVGEQSTRIARFKAGVDRGESITQAAFKSRDISLDFAKAGNSIKTINQVVPFLNAGIQGSEKLMRLYKTNPKAAIATTGILFGIPSVMLYAHNSQFNDYQDIPDAEKQTNWIILARDRTPEEVQNGTPPIGIKVPKGFMARMTSSSIESAMQFIKDKDPQSFGKSALDIGSSLSPIGLPHDSQTLGQSLSSILPPWLQAGVEWSTNKNLFFGNSIVPQGLENLPAPEQYKETTPEIYKVAGKVLNASPLKLENTVNSTTGGVGRQVASLLSGDLTGGSSDQVTRRFMQIRSGKKTEEAYQTVDKEKEYTALRNKQLKEAYQAGDKVEFQRLSQGMSKQQISSLINSVKDKEKEKLLTPEQRAYNQLSKEEKARLLKERPELRSSLELLPQADAAALDGFGEIDLTPPTKGEGIDAYVNQNWKFTKAVSIIGDPDYSHSQKKEAFKKLGVDEEQVRYAYKAGKSTDIKTQYIIGQNVPHDKLLVELAKGRVESVTGSQFASNAVLDNLADKGVISADEAKYLKSLKFDSQGNNIAKSKAKKGSFKRPAQRSTNSLVTKPFKQLETIKLKEPPKITMPKVSFATPFTPTGAIPTAPNFKTRVKFNL